MSYQFPNKFLTKQKFESFRNAFYKEAVKNPLTCTLRYLKQDASSYFLRDFTKSFTGTKHNVVLPCLYNVEEFEVTRSAGMNDNSTFKLFVSPIHLERMSEQNILDDFPTLFSYNGCENKFHILIDGIEFQVVKISFEGRVFENCVAVGFEGKLLYDA